MAECNNPLYFFPNRRQQLNDWSDYYSGGRVHTLSVNCLQGRAPPYGSFFEVPAPPASPDTVCAGRLLGIHLGFVRLQIFIPKEDLPSAARNRIDPLSDGDLREYIHELVETEQIMCVNVDHFEARASLAFVFTEEEIIRLKESGII